MLSKFTVAALTFAASTQALMLNLGDEDELPLPLTASCLNVSEKVITLAGEHKGEEAINNVDVLTSKWRGITDDFHLSSVEVCLERPEGHNDYEHSAIRGLQANIKNSKGEDWGLDVIGDMDCSDDEFHDHMSINGESVGELRLNFEPDGDGVAFRIIDLTKKKENYIVKGGERVKSDEKVRFDIPAD